MISSMASRAWIVVRRSATLTLALPLCGIAVALAPDLPSFQRGQWDFHRSVVIAGQKQPAVQSMQKCINPTDDIRNKWDSLARQACRFTPIRHSANKYEYSAMCNRNGVNLRMKSVITVHGDSAYEVVTDSVTGQRRSTESLSAHRIGDCAQPPAP